MHLIDSNTAVHIKASSRELQATSLDGTKLEACSLKLEAAQLERTHLKVLVY
jgi:hypothetical protein